MKKYISSIVLIVGSLLSIDCGSRVSRVTQTQLRSLQLGMSMSEVENRLGLPVYMNAAEKDVYISHLPQVDMVWKYDSHDSVVDVFRAVRLRVEFSKGALVYANSYHRALYGKTVELFTLNTDGRVEEGRAIGKWFAP